MARRRRLSEATCREDAAIAVAAAGIAETLASRHPDVIALKMAHKMFVDAGADLAHQAHMLAAKTPPGALLEGE